MEARGALREEGAAGSREGVLVRAFSPPCQEPWSRQAQEGGKGPQLRPWITHWPSAGAKNP